MLHRTSPASRIDPDCPEELHMKLRAELAARIVGQGVYRGETLDHLVKRVCPAVFDIAAAEGFKLRLDLPENTHKALCKGRLYLVIRKALH